MSMSLNLATRNMCSLIFQRAISRENIVGVRTSRRKYKSTLKNTARIKQLSQLKVTLVSQITLIDWLMLLHQQYLCTVDSS